MRFSLTGRQFIAPTPLPDEPKKEIGFHIKEEPPPYRIGKKAAREKPRV